VFFTAGANLADAVMKVALVLLAARLTSSPALVAGVLTALTLPWTVAALKAGAVVDRGDRRRLLVGAEAMRL